jgi:Invasin, domain 3/Bacterial Ig-like domain (group 3)
VKIVQVIGVVRGIVARIRHRLEAAVPRCLIRNVPSRSLIWLVLLSTVVSGWALAGRAQAAGPAKAVSVSLSAPSILADGTSTTTATATVTDNSVPPVGVAGDKVGFTASAGETVGVVTDHRDGTYTATITSSTTVGSATITAADSSVTPAVSGTAILIQTAGPPATVTVALSPSSIIANGTSTSTATATVTDAQGHLLPTEPVVFSSSDPNDKVSATTNAGNGTYTATITSSTTIGTPTLTATDGAVSGHQTLTQTAGPPATVTVALSPSSIIANSTSTSTATATVTDIQGHPIPTDTVAFSSTDPGQFFGPASNHGDGTYSAQIRGSTTVGRATITATDGTVSGQATLTQAAGPSNTSLVAAPSALVTNETVTLFADVSSATGSPSGTITFNNRGAPIAHCMGERITPSNPAATCQTSFAASTSPEQLTAVFTSDLASTAPGSTGATTLTVKPDSTSVSLDVPTTVDVGQRTTYTATVTPPASRPGPIEPSGSAEFFDSGKPIPSCLTQALVNGAATCTVAYKARRTHSIAARYGGDSNFTGSTASAQLISVVPVPVHVLGIITSTMQWTFYYTPAYTKVLSLVVNGASAGATVLVKCHGRGCPFAKHSTAVAKTRRCGQKGKRRCPIAGSIDLAPAFHQHRLHLGSKITVVISRPEWIGKYYAFTIRARRGPSIQITCLAPGRTRPGVGC